MLIDRLKTSAVLISLVCLLVYLDANFSPIGSKGILLVPLLLFFALGTASDLSQLIEKSGRKSSRRIALLATAGITLSATIPLLWPLFGAVYPADCPIGRLGWMVIAAVASVFLALGCEMWNYGKHLHGENETNFEKGSSIDRTCSIVFVSMYVGLPMSLLVCLRNFSPSSVTTNLAGEAGANWGLAALITLIAVTKSADIGAYFTGRSIGKHKLIPRLSPGKTWEGAVGGVVASTIVAFGCLEWLFPALSPTAPTQSLMYSIIGAFVLGPVLAISGMLGDLAESLVKRDAGAKDSGTWLPGMGGVWDVTDSLIAAVMPAYLCFVGGVAG